MSNLKPKTLNDVTYRNEFEALSVLEKLITKLIEEEFSNNPKLKQYVKKRFEGAREVLRRTSRDYFKPYELKSVVVSSKAVKRGEPKYVKLRTLEGKEILVKVGAPDEEAYHDVSVARYRLKCTCQDALLLTSAADKKLKQALLNAGITSFPTAELVFYKYVICKHTLAKLAQAMAKPESELGVINVDEEIADTLRIGLFAIYLRLVSKAEPKITRRIYKILRRRIK